MGAPFCRGIEPFLANLKTLIEEADRQGMQTYTATITAKAVYDDINGNVVYIPFGNDCERHTNEVKEAITRITAMLKNAGNQLPALPRPDAVAPEEPAFGVPTWAKFALFGVLGVAALHYLSPLISAAAPRRRVAGYRSRR